jgi:hypothetical protein
MGLSAENSRVYILGPGALGCAFASHLRHWRPVTLLGGRSDPRQMLWTNAEMDSTKAILESCEWSKDPLGALRHLSLDSNETHFLFSFLPTGQEEVFFSLIDVLSATPLTFNYVFCSNGLVPWDLLQKAKNRKPQNGLFRLLFFSGFSRNESKTELTHKGGVQVIGGDFFAQAGQNLSLQDLLKVTPNSQEFKPWPHFEWTWDSQIRLREFEKLYVNWMIAAGAGPNLVANGPVSEILSHNFSLLWARFFGACLKDRCKMEGFNLPLHFELQLVRIFKETASASYENVNSFSTAHFRGDRFPFVSLWSTILSMRTSLQSAMELNLKEIDASLEQIGKDWEVSMPSWK